MPKPSTSAEETPESGSHAFVPPPVDLVSPQLTLRALLTGMILGAVLSICNVYLGLKIGWGTNMSITGILLAYAFWGTLRGTTGGRVNKFGVLENNINQSACSAAAAVSSAGLVAPIPALTMLTGAELSWFWLSIWVFAVCLVGITVATGLRRQMIVVDRLPFPGGIACAETLREIYGHGAEAMRRVAVLGAGAVVAGAVKVAEITKLATAWAPKMSINGYPASVLDFKLEPSLLMVGVGGLIGFRAAASITLGAILAWGIIGPSAVTRGDIPLTVTESLTALPAEVDLASNETLRFSDGRAQLSFKGAMTADQREAFLARSDDPAWRLAIDRLWVASQWDDAEHAQAVQAAAPEAADAPRPTANFGDMLAWLLWPGVTLMVVASLVSFAFSWRSMIRAFTGSGGGGAVQDAGEMPKAWFIAGAVVALVLSVILQNALFGILVWAAIVGVLLSFALAIVGSRVSGETNITPVGAMGKVTQLIFGVIVPKSAAANLMAANVTGGAASQCADLMHDFKCGWMLGASPKKQFIAQVAGAFAGSIVGSYFYLVLVPDPETQLLTTEWPAPAVAAWKAVAELFMVGLDALPAGVLNAMAWAAAAGVVLPILEKVLPKAGRKLVPSAASIGLAFVVSPKYAISMFIGAVIALVLGKLFPRWTERFLITVCAGIVVGDSLVGAGDAFWTMFASLAAANGP
ncbi:MAG: OPT/YSL family transporter [Phycisphaerales bacterium]|nr:OPT/YSL family transporter [Phycisphaerales bacterium]